MALQKRIEHLEANGAFAAPTHSPEFAAYMGYFSRRSDASKEFALAFDREPAAGDVLRRDDLCGTGFDTFDATFEGSEIDERGRIWRPVSKEDGIAPPYANAAWYVPAWHEDPENPARMLRTPKPLEFRWARVAAEALGAGNYNFHLLCTQPPFTTVVFLGATGPESMCGDFKFGPQHMCRPATEDELARR